MLYVAGAENLTLEDLEEAVVNDDEAILQRVMRWGSCLRGTRQYWQYARKELKAISYGLEALTGRLPTVFFTLSPADLHWRDFHRHFPGKSQYLDKKISPDDDFRMRRDARQRAESLKNYPSISAWLFNQRVRVFLSTVLKPFFNVRDYWYRKEYQGRGSDHVHGFLWVKDAPPTTLLMQAVAEVMEAEEDKPITGDSCRGIADWVSQRLQLECKHPQLYRSKWPGGEDSELPTENVLRKTFAQMCGCRAGHAPPSRAEQVRKLDEATAHILNRCMIHKCSLQYCRKVKVKKKKEKSLQPAGGQLPMARDKGPQPTAPEVPVAPDDMTDPCRFFKPSREICQCPRCYPTYAPSPRCPMNSVRALEMDSDEEDNADEAACCRCVDCTGVECECQKHASVCDAERCVCHVGTKHGSAAPKTCWCTSKVYHRVQTETKNGKEKVRPRFSCCSWRSTDSCAWSGCRGQDGVLYRSEPRQTLRLRESATGGVESQLRFPFPG